MLIVMTPDAVESDIARVVEAIEKNGWSAHPLPGDTRTAVAVTGNRGSIDPALFENLPGVAEAIRVTKPYKLATDGRTSTRRAVTVGDTRIGDGSLRIIAGPCAVEGEEQVFAAAETVAASGVKLFRGGAYKPRTSPYAFQGLGEDGLKLLAAVKKDFGLAIVTEAMDERGIELVQQYGDCIQIGARNMQNFALLRAAGRARMPVLLKRGLSATLDELLLSAEYIMAEGNENVILCERGIRTFADHARNTLDISIVPALRRKSHLPVIVDPSHAAGHNYMVSPLARAAVAVGSDGLLIEMHPCPEEALCDGAQALTPGQYLALIEEVKALHQALDRESLAVG
jgi:3-deoxy-7-phosphoheptulonate synthase